MLDSRRTGWLGSDSRISSTQSFLLEIRLPLKSQMLKSAMRVFRIMKHVTFNHGVEGSNPSALTKNTIKIKWMKDRAGDRWISPTTGVNAVGYPALPTWIFRRSSLHRHRPHHAQTISTPIAASMESTITSKLDAAWRRYFSRQISAAARSCVRGSPGWAPLN